MKIVAEVAQAHDGSLGTALAYVKAIAAAGADAAKFQDHRFDECNRFRPGTESLFVQDESRKYYWLRTAFLQDGWQKIRQACRDEGVEYIVSPFSMLAFYNQSDLNPDRWKIASSKVNDYELIDACVKTGKPVILSSGMSTWDEVEDAVGDRVPANQLCILQCTSIYPCPPERVGLSDEFIERMQVWGEIGLSDHSGKIWPSLVAAAKGLSMAEVHVVFSRECFGPDVSSSITTAELRQLVEGVRFIERMQTGDKGKDEMAAELKDIREVFCGR